MARRKWNYETIQQVLNGEQPFIQSGYTKKYKRRKIGEEWTDSKGDVWKKTDANSVVKVNKQMDSIRELVKPRCIVCNMDMNLFGTKSDWKVFSKTQKCFECLEIEETTLRCVGKFEDYEYKKMLNNKLSKLIEFKKNVVETIEYLKNDSCKMEIVCSNGTLVTWEGAQNKSLLEEAKEDLIKAEKEILELEDAVSKLN